MSYSIQKESILNILHSTENHYSVHEIHNRLTKIIPGVSLMTVYRNLNKLEKKGVVFPFHVENVLHYCGNKKLHFHIHCIDCGDVVDVYNTNINNFILNNVTSEEFFPLSNGMVINGLCKECKVQSNGDDRGD